MAKFTTESLNLDEAGNTVDLLVGTGDPNGAVTAVTGSLFFDATTPGLYQNDSGGTVWSTVGGGGWPTTVGTDYAGTPYEQAAVAAVDGNIVLSPNGTGAIVAQVPDGTVAGGNSRGNYAVDLQRSRVLATQVAAGNFSVVGGGQYNEATQTWATVGGGLSNKASSPYTTASGGEKNTASAGRATVSGGRENTASGYYSTISGGRQNVASASQATVSGGWTNTASANRSTVGGGRQNTASGSYSSVGGGTSNGATGLQSTVGGGQQNLATGSQSSVCGGLRNNATQQYATIGGGDSIRATGFASTVGGGTFNQATRSYSTVSGGSYGLADHYGESAHASGQFAALGDAQYSRTVLRRVTPDATPLELSANGAAPAAGTRLDLADKTGYQFHIQVIARDTSGTDSAWWDVKGCIVRSVGAGTTTLIGTNVVSSSSTAGAAAWALTATADTVNGALKVEATGAAATTIRWVATIHSTKVAY